MSLDQQPIITTFIMQLLARVSLKADIMQNGAKKLIWSWVLLRVGTFAGGKEESCVR